MRKWRWVVPVVLTALAFWFIETRVSIASTFHSLTVPLVVPFLFWNFTDWFDLPLNDQRQERARQSWDRLTPEQQQYVKDFVQRRFRVLRSKARFVTNLTILYFVPPWRAYWSMRHAFGGERH